jgi:predicted Abi (CAAX) family protease
MKIIDLKKIIEHLPDDMEIIIQKDSEGNDFSPLSEVDDNCIYIPDSTWSGDVYSKEFSADDMLMSEDEWEEMKKKPSVCVLVPVN